MAPTEAKSNPEAGVRLAINTFTRRLYFFNGERLINEYSVAVGKPATPTPTGNYKVKNKILNPGGALGTRWMGLTIPGGVYGIHGNNNPSSIGRPVSLGCIRMFNNQIEGLFPKIAIGTPVHIYNNYTTAAPAMETENNSNAKASGGDKTGSNGPGNNLNGQRYTILPGDTIWRIAQRFKVSQKEIIAVNALSDPNRINVGQIITIPDRQSDEFNLNGSNGVV